MKSHLSCTGEFSIIRPALFFNCCRSIWIALHLHPYPFKRNEDITPQKCMAVRDQSEHHSNTLWRNMKMQMAKIMNNNTKSNWYNYTRYFVWFAVQEELTGTSFLIIQLCFLSTRIWDIHKKCNIIRLKYSLIQQLRNESFQITIAILSPTFMSNTYLSIHLINLFPWQMFSKVWIDYIRNSHIFVCCIFLRFFLHIGYVAE